MTRARTAPAPEVIPAQFREPMVALAGGPLAGHWFSTADWDEYRATCQRMVDKGQRPSPALRYADAGRLQKHPKYGDRAITGQMWTFRD